MIRKFTQMIFAASLILFSTTAFAQTTVTGIIKDAASGEPLIGTQILVKGTVLGTITGIDGSFELKTQSPPPITLVISYVGYERQEIEVTSSGQKVSVQLSESTLLGQEVVISASRVEENILQSPVSIEKMDILAVQNSSAPSYYEGIANLKGVDVASSSINFQIINARGFGSTGNTRFVQLIDGMDTQAPALNFPIGNLNGPSELDVESVEMIPGASSALYGPNAFNGILLINSKNPFEYQGLSAFFKTGVNHVGDQADQDPAIMNTISIRYAKAFNNKLAFKVNGTYSHADDWHGTSRFDRNAADNPFIDEGIPNIGADRLHLHGDEAAANIALLGVAAANRIGDSGAGLASIWGNQQNTLPNGNTLLDYALDLPSQTVSLTPFEEVDLINYGAENIKFNAGLYYRLNDELELSGLYNAGFGTSIYTGAQRYSLSNFGIQQTRLQLRGDNFFVRAYGTFENSGDSYITEFLALKTNEELAFSGSNNYFSSPTDQRYVPLILPGNRSVNNIFSAYSQAYMQFLATGNGGNLPGLDPGEIGTLNESLRTQYQIAAHQRAREFIDDVFYAEPGTQEFEDAKAAALNGTIPDGPGFADKSAMYQADFQYDFKNQIDFMEFQVGGSYRIFDLRSEGTIFPDKDGGIQINEFGGYAQFGKRVTDNLKLSGSVRFDKNENFDGQVNPRISAVYTVADNHNFRGSIQTGFRNPTTQGQFIDLSVISARLLGGLQENYDKYDLAKTSSIGQPLAFTAGSVNRFRSAFFSDPADVAGASANLVPFTANDIRPVMPEEVRSLEFGYKSLIGNKLLVDAVYYHNTYTNFITQIQIVVANEYTSADAPDASLVGQANPLTIISGSAITRTVDTNGGVSFSGNTAQIYSNLDDEVTSQGAALGLTYNLPQGYTIGGNYNWNKLSGGFTENNLSEFNTPEHKFNVQFGNRKLTDKLGFNVTYRWQDAFRWESSFAIGDVPSYGTLDAMVSLKLDEINSILRVGGSNIGGNPYIQSLGGPNIGTMYYVSITFDELMN